MKWKLLVSILMFVNTSFAGASSAEPVQIYVQPVEPIEQLREACHKTHTREPKYTLHVKTNDPSHRDEDYRIFGDLCHLMTAQTIGTVYVSDDGIVIGLSGSGSEEYPVFSRYAVHLPRVSR